MILICETLQVGEIINELTAWLLHCMGSRFLGVINVNFLFYSLDEN